MDAQTSLENATSALVAAEDRIAARKDPGAKKSALPDPEELPLRVRNVAALRGLGFSFVQIGQRYGITPQAASILLIKQKGLLSQAGTSSEFDGLSPRAVNCLGRLRIRNRAMARRHPNLDAALKEQRNCGQKTTDEILRWARLDSLAATKQSARKKLRCNAPATSLHPV